MDWHKWTESCQAVTSLATPPSQPQEIPRSRSQILNHPACLCVFHVCACAHLHVHVCMPVIFRQVKHLEWFTLEEGLFCSTLTECFFPCQYQQYHRWQRAWRVRELYSPTQVNTWALLCYTRDSSQLSSWVMRTRAPGRPCHPGKYQKPGPY